MSSTLGSNSGPQQDFMRAKHFETVLTAFSSSLIIITHNFFLLSTTGAGLSTVLIASLSGSASLTH